MFTLLDFFLVLITSYSLYKDLPSWSNLDLQSIHSPTTTYWIVSRRSRRSRPNDDKSGTSPPSRAHNGIHNLHRHQPYHNLHHCPRSRKQSRDLHSRSILTHNANKWNRNRRCCRVHPGVYRPPPPSDLLDPIPQSRLGAISGIFPFELLERVCT